MSHSDLVLLCVRSLRRASENAKYSDTRRFFRLFGMPVEIDLNVVRSVLLGGLASGIEYKSGLITGGLRKKYRVNRRGKTIK